MSVSRCQTAQTRFIVAAVHFRARGFDFGFHFFLFSTVSVSFPFLLSFLVCPASLRDMWTRELAGATIAAQVVGMEELGRDTFDAAPFGDADVVLIDESHNFRNDKANRYVALDTLMQLNGGRGRDGEHKKVTGGCVQQHRPRRDLPDPLLAPQFGPG